MPKRNGSYSSGEWHKNIKKQSYNIHSGDKKSEKW